MVKASDVPGLMEKKIEMDFYGESTLPYNQTCVNVGFNDAIKQIGSKTLKLKRDEAAEIMYSADRKLHPGGMKTIHYWKNIVDALNASLKDLLVAE